MKSIREIENLSGKKVLVRVDWSVPMNSGKILNDFQIRATLPTIEYLKNAGAEVILATHLEKRGDPIELLYPYLPEGVKLLPDLRDSQGEEENSPEFAKELAGLAEIYVNEAFSVSHRKHASVIGVPQYLPSYAGINFIKEIESLSKAFTPLHPFLFILGGAKFETKIPLVDKFLDLADIIFIAGANAKPACDTDLKNNLKVVFPLGDIAALDADGNVIEQLRGYVEKSEFIVWNGPVGKYEDGLKEGTLATAQMIADSGKISIVGGGDTLTAIKELNLYDKFTFVSTGGGAMLDFLATGTLPGIEALGN